MPDGNDDGADGVCLEDDAADAPLQPHVLLVHIHLTFREDMHPVAQLELLDAQVDGRLVNAGATHAGNAFAEHEEHRVEFVGEADVVGCEAPSDAFGAAHVLHLQAAPYGRVVEAAVMVGDRQKRLVGRPIHEVLQSVLVVHFRSIQTNCKDSEIRETDQGHQLD